PLKSLVRAVSEGEVLAVRSEGHGEATIPFIDRQRADFLARVRVPQPQRPCEATGRKNLPIGREGQPLDRRVVPQKSPPFFSGANLPQAQVVILTAGSQPFAVGREGNAIHVALVALQNANFLPRVRVPQPDPVVIPSGGEELSVRGEGEASRKGLAKAHGAEPHDSPL